MKVIKRSVVKLQSDDEIIAALMEAFETKPFPHAPGSIVRFNEVLEEDDEDFDDFLPEFLSGQLAIVLTTSGPRASVGSFDEDGNSSTFIVGPKNVTLVKGSPNTATLHQINREQPLRG